MLTEYQAQRLRAAEENPVELTEDAILAAASERARLDDFGPGDFRERVRLLVEELDGNDNATELARAALYDRLVAALVNRLLRWEYLRRHPEVEEIEIARPIFVTGLPRSGTTHIAGLLAANPALRSLPYWEALQPIPFPWERLSSAGRDPRHLRARQGWARTQKLNPLQAAHHALDPDHIHEDFELQVPDVASYAWALPMRMPRWRDRYLADDQRPHYEFARTTLKIMSRQDGRLRRWVLKYPYHLEQLRALMAVFPDAFVVFMHRDPVAALKSIMAQHAYVIRLFERRVDPDWYLEDRTRRMRDLLEAYVRDIDLVPASQRADVTFDDLVRDNLGTLERIYDLVGLELTDDARASVRAYLADHERHKHGAIDHDLRRDFGVEPEELRRRFAFYLDRVPLRAEIA